MGWKYATNDDTNSKRDFLAALRDQPLNIGFEVTESFEYYQSGVFTGEDCSGVQDHAMQAVGYYMTGANYYAIVRN